VSILTVSSSCGNDAVLRQASLLQLLAVPCKRRQWIILVRQGNTAKLKSCGTKRYNCTAVHYFMIHWSTNCKRSPLPVGTTDIVPVLNRYTLQRSREGCCSWASCQGCAKYYADMQAGQNKVLDSKLLPHSCKHASATAIRMLASSCPRRMLAPQFRFSLQLGSLLENTSICHSSTLAQTHTYNRDSSCY
jgi:hypothetical protein